MKQVIQRWGRFVALAAVGVITQAAETPLPEWTQTTPPGEVGRLGGLLWPQPGNDGLNVDAETGAVLAPGPGLADSPEHHQPNVEIGSFLLPSPKVKKVTTPPLAATPLGQLRDTSKEFIAQCYQSTGEQFILDPGYQLSELERDDFERFLAYHARDSRIQAHVLLLAKDERLPANMSLARIAGGALLKQNTCLLVLPVGEPNRARLFFTNNVHQAAPPATLAEVLSECIKESLAETEPVEQVHRMLVKLSIRLFWLQNHLEPAVPTVVKPEAEAPITELRVPEVKLTEVTHHSDSRWAQALQSLTSNLPLLLGFCALALIGGLWTALRWRRFQLRSNEWILPFPHEEDPPQRLGGRFSGAAGAALVYR